MLRLLFTVLTQLLLIGASHAFCKNGNTRGNAALRSVSEASSLADEAISTPSNSQSSSKHSIHLISLPPKDDSFSLPAESLVRECWQWKDSVLGDGRDYFVPRPKSLKAFNSLFVGMEIVVDIHLCRDGTQINYTLNRVTLKLPSKDSVEVQSIEIPYETSIMKQTTTRMTKSYTIAECVALSNCARFEVMLVLKDENPQSADSDASQYIKMAQSASRVSVAYHLWRQTQNYKTKNPSFLQISGLASWLDLPETVDTSTINTRTNKMSAEECNRVVQLSQRMTGIADIRQISTHLSLIASGLAARTNRPEREVIFRPYSSRDAHILLQLKRTSEVVSALDAKGGGRLKILLDAALTAGKAARNERIVPDIKQLKEFGSDGTPPSSLANVIANAAVEMAVNPSVDACVARLKATESASQISILRHRITDIVQYLTMNDAENSRSELSKIANVLLHAPTMKLREGQMTDEEMESIMAAVESELKTNAARLKTQLIDDT